MSCFLLEQTWHTVKEHMGRAWAGIGSLQALSQAGDRGMEGSLQGRFHANSEPSCLPIIQVFSYSILHIPYYVHTENEDCTFLFV